MSNRYQILSKFVRQRPQNRLRHKINAMAEGARRFGFPEMMFVIREAVRPSRRPSSYLSSRDVSKYIRNRYGLDKKAESNIPVPARYENAEYINKRSLSLNVPKETPKEDNRAKSLPRQLETQKTDISNKKSISGIALNGEPQQQTLSALVKQKTEKQQRQKENELKESNLKRNAKRFVKAAMSGTLMSEKSNYEILKATPRPEKLVRDSNKNKEKKKTFDDFQDRFYQREESVKEANFRKLRERKIMVLTKRDLIYSKLQAKHLAMKQAVAMRSRKTRKETFSKELLEPKIWTQIKNAYKEEQEKRKKSPPVADQCEALILKTKDARNRLIEDLRIAEQRRQIELLRSMARETLNRHLEETRKQKTFSNFMGAY